MTKSKSKAKYWALGFSAVLVVIDQLTKQWAKTNLIGGGRQEVIRGLFYLTYVENRGAAFGILQGATGILSLITGLVLLVLLVYLLSGRVKGSLLPWVLSLVLAGGAGNLIDRVKQGFVVDFLDFSALFGFPVFNFADCCVVVGALLLICCAFWWPDPAGAEKAQLDIPEDGPSAEGENEDPENPERAEE